MCQNIRISGYQIIRFLLIVFFVLSSFVLRPSLFAEEVPRFYGEEIVVTALRVPHLKSTLPWDTEVITRKEIEDSSAVNLGDMVRAISGLAVKSNGGLGGQISSRFRGANASQVLVLLNGNRINSPCLGTFDLADILLTDVEKIEVVKAPLSAVYGADAVGGVVNIITRKASEQFQTGVSLNYGEFSTRNLSVSTSGPHYFFSAASLYSAGFRDNSDYKADDFNLRLSSGIGKAYLEAGIKKYSATKGTPGSLDYLTPQARQTDNDLFYDVQCRADEVGLKISWSQTALDQNYKNPQSFPPINTTTKTLTTNTDIQKAVDWGRYNTMLLGLELRNDSNAGSTNSDNSSIDNRAIYLQDEVTLPNLANIVLGARGDINAVYGNHLSPRIGFVFEPWYNAFIKTSWGSSFKAPTINDLYWTKLTETTDWGGVTYVSTTEGNPNLRAETAQSIDLTLEKVFDEQSSARVSYFTNSIKDLIRWSTTYLSTTEFVTSPQNVSSAAIQGMEFEYRREIRENLDGFVNFTYQIAKDTNTDKFLDYAPQLQYNAGLKYQDKNRFDSHVLIKHVGERKTNLANTYQLPAYTMIDLSLAKDFGRWRLKLDVNNLFNQSYAESWGFTDVYPMPGRRYSLGVKWGL